LCALKSGVSRGNGLLIISDASDNSCCRTGCPPLPPGSDAAVWTALTNDTGAFVLVIDENGIVVCCNDLVNDQIGAEHAPLEGKPVSAFCSEGVAQECAQMILLTIEQNRPINMVGMCKGIATRSLTRPLPTSAGMPRCALKIVRPLTQHDVEDVRSGQGVWIKASSYDLGRLSVLTSRELEVLRLIGESMTTAEIADRLHRSVKTIEWHRVSLGSKLGAANRVELASIATNAGLQYLEDEMFAKICKLSVAEQAVHPF
jgi:PAS domain S-box-containing protein